ncbi:hypothetical protein C4D60_Mb03t19010 [Musa balbisiana]|uniref:Uncharacterized protein n=1 Tax=Musa balbisiana TaxID=52838 RepID=A0A4S8JC13_MUSBA|nr:hypothetical protein C4D60_Mb03t19010 [Musa balbisiana]
MDRAGPGRVGPSRVCILWTSESLGKSASFWWHSLGLVFPLISARRGSTRDRESGTEGRLVRSASMDEQFSDAAVVFSDEICKSGRCDQGGLVVLLVVGGLILLFLLGNHALYMYAQKTLPPRRKKPISNKGCLHLESKHTQ